MMTSDNFTLSNSRFAKFMRVGWIRRALWASPVTGRYSVSCLFLTFNIMVLNLVLFHPMGRSFPGFLLFCNKIVEFLQHCVTLLDTSCKQSEAA